MRYDYPENPAEQVLKSFSGRKSSLKPPVLDFVIVFHLVLKNQESWELWLDVFWGNKHWKMQKINAENFGGGLWAPIMDLLTALKYEILFFF